MGSNDVEEADTPLRELLATVVASAVPEVIEVLMSGVVSSAGVVPGDEDRLNENVSVLLELDELMLSLLELNGLVFASLEVASAACELAAVEWAADEWAADEWAAVECL